MAQHHLWLYNCFYLKLSAFVAMPLTDTAEWKLIVCGPHFMSLCLMKVNKCRTVIELHSERVRDAVYGTAGEYVVYRFRSRIIDVRSDERLMNCWTFSRTRQLSSLLTGWRSAAHWGAGPSCGVSWSPAYFYSTRAIKPRYIFNIQYPKSIHFPADVFHPDCEGNSEVIKKKLYCLLWI